MNFLKSFSVLTRYCFMSVVLVICSQSSYAQYKLNYGLQHPQDSLTLPKSLTPADKAIRKPKMIAKTALVPTGDGEFELSGGWELIEAAKVKQNPNRVSMPQLPTQQWYNATVPGTVLTTLVNQGVYPDPYMGLNNLLIPDSLCRKDWWYRTVFNLNDIHKRDNAWLIFEGINYEADIWLNGQSIGKLKGAFKRGRFDISKWLNAKGQNVLAVNIIPPPHPGIPHEQSAKAGMGPNGGMLALDGPTFISSEGWDWIPGIRDRNIGIWQPVKLKFTGPVTITDPQIITDLKLPDTTAAYLTVKATVTNNSAIKQQSVIKGAIGDIIFSKKVILKPGQTQYVVFTPDNYKQLIIKNPRLWWPNGYGAQNLYKATITTEGVSQVQYDCKTVRFGIREMSYELMVDAVNKKDWRISYSPTDSKNKVPLFNYSIRREVEKNTVVPALRAGIDTTAFTTINSKNPFLTIKVNGQPIFCRGGNWGMDDGMKRVSREQLEPAFKLHKYANYNIIRNWTGESTEETFYELADEYGMLVWNDFWISTEGYNLPPTDDKLFLANTADVIRRFRNHPSIAIWCPRNEGYAPDGIEDKLAQQIATEDGTRHYIGNSRFMNLRNSGGWGYLNNPQAYFTEYADGFSTEIGTFSVPVASTIRKFIGVKDQWPISDAWHYHDLHTNNQNLEGYLHAVDSLYGKATNLDDFNRKVQLINYDSHRAIFEAWNSKLWHNTSGILLWMTHPAWPSMIWQTYSWDFETHGSYFGAKEACQAVHVQMNMPDNKVIALNTTLANFNQSKVSFSVYDLNGKEIYKAEKNANIAANNKTDVFTPALDSLNLPGVYMVKLTLTDNEGKLLSENTYWKNSAKSKDFQAFNNLPDVNLTGNVISKNKSEIRFQIQNRTASPVIGVKLNLVDGKQQIILPAYFSDGYFTLLPGERKDIVVAYHAGTQPLSIQTSGYNNKGSLIKIQ